MSKRFGRRQKAKLREELAEVKETLKYSERDAAGLKAVLDNAPHTYKLAAEICQIAKNINQDFNIIQPQTRKRIGHITMVQNICSSAVWKPHDKDLRATTPDETLNINAAQVYEDIEDVLDDERGRFQKMRVFTFKYGGDSSCLQMSEEELRYSSHQAIVDQLVAHMKTGLSRYNGELG